MAGLGQLQEWDGAPGHVSNASQSRRNGCSAAKEESVPKAAVSRRSKIREEDDYSALVSVGGTSGPRISVAAGVMISSSVPANSSSHRYRHNKRGPTKTRGRPS